ncbi:MAG TPA: hypothetical protein VNN72_17195 [Polyangiaceae bacterium]|nr:hypothetical protein [Polyangiaceae bacterium]
MATLLVSFLALAFSACGGTSVNHVPADTGGTAGTTGGTGHGGTGGTTSGSGGAHGGTAGTTGGSGATPGAGGTTGGSGATPGAGGTTAGTGGFVGGAGGTGAVTCDFVRQQAQDELAHIQACNTDADCGQVLSRTSCGCTRDLVARLDADTKQFYAWKDVTVDGEQCNEFGSTCDCPKADGFVCAKGRCAWNYVSIEPPPLCSSAALGSMCIVGTPIDSGDVLAAGAPLVLMFRPSGCYSSSCTKVLTSSCDVKPDGNDFYVAADMCLAQISDPNVGCTDDCGGGGQLTCNSEYVLTEGTHTVHYAGGELPLDLTFTVPSIVIGDTQCATIDPLR